MKNFENQLSETIYTQASSSYLTSNDGDILIPFTRSELVYFKDGATLAEKLVNVPTDADIRTLNFRLEEMENTIKRFRFDIGSTDNYYRLKEINNQADALYRQLNDIRVQIDRFNEVDGLISSADNRITTLETNFTNLHDNVNRVITNFDSTLTRINDEIDRIKDQLVTPPLVKPVTVQTDDFGSLLAIADMYEEMCTVVPTMSTGEVKQSIVDTYRKLYKAELKSLDDMPDHIKDYIIAELITL